jgi:hypothetical protein
VHPRSSSFLSAVKFFLWAISRVWIGKGFTADKKGDERGCTRKRQRGLKRSGVPLKSGRGMFSAIVGIRSSRQLDNRELKPSLWGAAWREVNGATATIPIPHAIVSLYRNKFYFGSLARKSRMAALTALGLWMLAA